MLAAREAVGTQQSVPRRRILPRDRRHVAVGAGLRRFRVVEGTGALSRDPARLPVVVAVEAAQPAVVVHRAVEVHLVAGGAEGGAVPGVERLQERLAVRRRVEMGSRGRGASAAAGPRRPRGRASPGTSITNPAFPMVSFTRVIAWQETQPSPALAEGRSTISASGRSISPLKRTAWSWQPAHHFDGSVPTTPCMYSMERRYQGLLKEAKRCADSLHWAVCVAVAAAALVAAEEEVLGDEAAVRRFRRGGGKTARRRRPSLRRPSPPAGARRSASAPPRAARSGGGRRPGSPPPAPAERRAPAGGRGVPRSRRRRRGGGRGAAGSRGSDPKTKRPAPLSARTPPVIRNHRRSGSRRSAGADPLPAPERELQRRNAEQRMQEDLRGVEEMRPAGRQQVAGVDQEQRRRCEEQPVSARHRVSLCCSFPPRRPEAPAARCA